MTTASPKWRSHQPRPGERGREVVISEPPDLVELLTRVFKSFKLREKAKEGVSESAAQRFRDEVALALLGHKQTKLNELVTVVMRFYGKKIRLERLDPDPSTHIQVTYPNKTAADLVEGMKGAEGGAWTGNELQSRFDLRPAILHRRRKENRIVYWRDSKHQFHYPKWQFTESGALIAGLQEALAVFKSLDEWRVMRYFLAPRHELGDSSPLALLRAGKKDEVIAHAKAHAEENTW